MQFNTTLDYDNQVNPDQEHKLILAMHEESKALKTDPTKEDLANPSNMQRAMDVIIAEQRQLNEKYIERAQAILTSVQLEKFGTYLKQQTDLQEAMSPMVNEMMKSMMPTNK